MSSVRSIAHTSLSETTLHGIARITSDSKPWYIRIIWGLLFAAFLGLMLKEIVQLSQKLQSKPILTTLKPQAVDFVFPDIYLCPTVPISGSYPYDLTANISSTINSHLDFAKTSTFPFQPLPTQIVHTVPYSLLADNIGHRSYQSFLSITIHSPLSEHHGKLIEMIPFYHPKYLTCFRPNISEQIKQLIINDNSVTLQFVVFLDTYNNHIPKTKPLLKTFNVGFPVMTTIEPVHWRLDMFNPYDTQIAYKLFLVPQYEYPDYQTNFLLGPGYFHYIQLSMTEHQQGEGLEDTCVASPPTVNYINPYDNELFGARYSETSCLHKYVADIIAEVFKRYKPTQPRFEQHQSILNLYNLHETNFSYFFSTSTLVGSSKNKDKIAVPTKYAAEYCRTRLPCVTKTYVSHKSFGKWPSVGTMHDFIKNIINPYVLKQKSQGTATPGLDFMSNLNNAVLTGVPYLANKSIEEHKEILTNYVYETVMKISLRPKEVKSMLIAQKVAFTTNDFLASMGGLLGLYIGCSVMSMFELLEFFHNFTRMFIISCGKSSKVASPKKQDSLDQEQDGQRKEEEHHV